MRDFFKWKSPHGRRMPELSERPLLMGILNITPDSFSDGGKFFNLEDALLHAEKMISEGADIIDVGAESTRPGFSEVQAKTEIERLVPFLREFRKINSTAVLSVDTYKPEVAEAAVSEGVDIINDVRSDCSESGFPMASLAAKLKAPLVITHNMRMSQISDEDEAVCAGMFSEKFLFEMKARVDSALAEGLERNAIILDPGVGFGKTFSQNFELVKNLDFLSEFPVLLGVSKKSMLREIVGSSDADLSFASSMISGIVALKNSAQILRVHNVRESALAIEIVEKFKESKRWTK